MENIESPIGHVPLNLSTRSIERNVLKELNNIDGADKSPKETSLADRTEIHAKDNLLPVIHTKNRLSDGSDKVPVNKTLLRVATPTAGTSSDDEEFVDCNTTFSTSAMDCTLDGAAIISNEAGVNSETSDSSMNVSNLASIFNMKLNLGFIETEGVGQVDTDKPTVNILNTGEGECGSKDSTISTISSFIDDSQAAVNKSSGGKSNEINNCNEGHTLPVIEQALTSKAACDVIAVAPERTFDPEMESTPVIELAPVIETPLEISAIESDPAIESEPAIKSTPTIESKPAIESDPAIESKPEVESEPVNEPETAVESEPAVELEPAIESKPAIDSDPAIESKPDVESEPVNEPETAVESEPVVELEPAIESKPAIDSDPAIQSKPEVESEPAIEPKPAIESELAKESEPVIESKPAIESDPAIESKPDVESEPVNEPETAVESEPVVELKPSDESEPAIESKPTIESEPAIESETAIESVAEVGSEPAVESDPTIQSEPAIESKHANNPLIESKLAMNIESKEPAIEYEHSFVSTAILDPASPNQSPPIETKPANNVESVIETVPVFESAIVDQSEPIESSAPRQSVIEPTAPESESTIVTEPVIESEPIVESEPEIETEPANEWNPVIEPAILTQSEPIEFEVANRAAAANDTDAIIPLESATQIDQTLHSTHKSDELSICQPETTFIDNNDEINQTVPVESISSKSESQTATAIVTESEAFDVTKLTRSNKIDEFKANKSFSEDSLNQDTEAQDCLFDSLEVPPATPTVCSDLTEHLERKDTFDIPNPVAVNIEHSGDVKLNGPVSTLSRKDTFSVRSPQNKNPSTISRRDTFLVQSPQNVSSSLSHQETFEVQSPQSESIPSISRQDTFSLLLPQNETTSPLTTVSCVDTSSFLSPQSDSGSSIDDITVLLNKVTINSPIVNAAGNRIKRSATFKKSNCDGVNQSLSIDESNESKLQTPPAIINVNAIDLNQDHLPEMVLSPNDFDFLQSRGAQTVVSEEDRRSSLLLRFDPLSGRTVRTQLLAATEEAVESSVATDLRDNNQPFGGDSSKENTCNEQSSSKAESSTANASEMSVSLVHDPKSMDNDTNSFTNNIKADIAGGVPLSDKKIKFEYADENIRKKMEEYEATQEILVKRFTEKEKTLAKNCAIIEAYEKALAELVAEKEKLTDQHEVANERLRQERDVHHQHLMSLEITFSDLHKKYERSKEIALQLRERYDVVSEEKAMIDELVKQQELRYEKMKQHALQQLEYANSTLEEQEKSNSRENSRLKALLKIEEVSRNTMQEQLLQKCKENKELVKICDELIGGGQKS